MPRERKSDLERCVFSLDARTRGEIDDLTTLQDVPNRSCIVREALHSYWKSYFDATIVYTEPIDDTPRD